MSRAGEGSSLPAPSSIQSRVLRLAVVAALLLPKPSAGALASPVLGSVTAAQALWAIPSSCLTDSIIGSSWAPSTLESVCPGGDAARPAFFELLLSWSICFLPLFLCVIPSEQRRGDTRLGLASPPQIRPPLLLEGWLEHLPLNWFSVVWDVNLSPHNLFSAF